MNQNYERGIGFVAMIIIVAAISLGGYGAVKVYQNSKVAVDTEEQQQDVSEIVTEIRSDVVATLGMVSSSVVLSAQASVDAAVKSLTDLSARVDAAVLASEGSDKAELMELKSEVEKLKSRLKSKNKSSIQDIIDVIEDIQTDIEASVEVSEDSETGGEGSSMPEGIEVDSEVEGDVDMEVGEVEVGAEGTATTSVEVSE